MRLDPATFGREQPCFGCSPTHPTGFRLEFERDGDEVRTRFTPRAEHQGPPGLLHGGLAMTLADELAAWTIVAHKQRLGFTAAAETRFHKPLYVGREVVGVGRIAQDGSRVVKIDVELTQDGARAFTGRFTFAVLDRRGAERVLGGPLPEAWAKFCRS